MRKYMSTRAVLAAYLFLVVLATDIIVGAKASTLVTLLAIAAFVVSFGILAAALAEKGRRPTAASEDSDSSYDN